MHLLIPPHGNISAKNGKRVARTASHSFAESTVGTTRCPPICHGAFHPPPTQHDFIPAFQPSICSGTDLKINMVRKKMFQNKWANWCGCGAEQPMQSWANQPVSAQLALECREGARSSASKRATKSGGHTGAHGLVPHRPQYRLPPGIQCGADPSTNPSSAGPLCHSEMGGMGF